MFSEELEKYSWDDITACINSKQSRDVEIALGKEHLTIDDFMALVSPAAAPYLEPMAALSRRYTQERFGKTIQMYVPLSIAGSTTTTPSLASSSPKRRSRTNAAPYASWAPLRTCSSSPARIRAMPV